MFSCFSCLFASNKDKIIYDKDITQVEKHKKITRFCGKSGYYLVTSVYDGDTITILVPVIFKVYSFNQNKNSVNLNSEEDNNITFLETSIRILEIDTYEIKPKANIPNREEHIKKAKEGKQFVEDLILNKNVYIEFSDKKFDPYGRPLAIVYYENKKISDMLIEKGLGVSYDGGKKTL